jgi:hypothetical protein
MINVMNRVPVNKVSSVVVNQCGCADKLELNGLLDQRAQLKINATKWMQAKSRKYKADIRDANKELQKLNKQLRPYDEWHRNNTAKDFDSAFRLVVKNTFGIEVYKQLELQAKGACGS